MFDFKLEKQKSLTYGALDRRDIYREKILID